MKRVALGVIVSFTLLVGLIASPASADNPPGYPDLVGFAWDTTVPPEPTLPADMSVPTGIFPFYDPPTIFTGDPDVHMMPMVLEIWPGLALGMVAVTRDDGAGGFSGYNIGVLGPHVIDGNRHTISGTAYFTDVTGTTIQAVSVGAMTIIDN